METPSFIHEKLVAFLRKNHLEEIYSLLPSSTFHIALSLNEPEEIQEIFLQEPERFEQNLRLAIMEILIEYRGPNAKRDYNKIQIKLLDSKLIKLSDINDSHINSPIFFDCSIIGVEPMESYIEKACFTCNKCGKDEFVTLSKDEKIQPMSCPHCSSISAKDRQPMYFVEKKSKQNFVQKVLVQEPDTNNPLILWAEVTNETVGKIEIGAKKRVLAVLRTQYQEKINRGKFLLNVLSLQSLEDTKEVQLSDEDINYYKEISLKDPETFMRDYLAKSVAPQVEGRELEKTFVLFSLVGGLDIGTYKAELNLLLAGDPSTAKSEILKYFSFKLVQKGAYIDGPNASTAGLLYGLDEYEGKKILRAGAFVVNNGGHIVIDELDKMNPIVRSSLNSALGSGIAKYDKNGHDIETPIKTTMIGGCNPNNESWKDSLSVLDNLSPLEEPIINKFATIICLKDRPHRDRDTKLINHIFENFATVSESIIRADVLKGLANYCRKQRPKITKEAEDFIKKTYIDFRQIEQDEKSLPIKPRQAVGLIQLCIAYSKWTFQDTVTIKTAETIIDYYKKTLETLGMNTDRGIVQSNLHGTAKDHKTAFLEIIRAEANEQGKFTEQQIKIAMGNNPHWQNKPDHAHVFWIKMEREGIIHHVKDGWYERV